MCAPAPMNLLLLIDSIRLGRMDPLEVWRWVHVCRRTATPFSSPYSLHSWLESYFVRVGPEGWIIHLEKKIC